MADGESTDQRLAVLAKAFETLAVCTKDLVDAEAQFEPKALDLALNYIGARFFFSTPYRIKWQEDQYRHWIQDARSACYLLIERSRGRRITQQDLALIFKAPPPE